MNLQEFLSEYERIKKTHPVVPAHIEHSENCTGDYIFQSKDLYNCFDVSDSRSGAYLFDGYMLINSYDCDYCISSEYLYESENCANCYNSSYLEDCADMIDCHWCDDCIDLKNCFGCVRLSHKQYCLFNRQYTKEEYLKRLARWRDKLPEEILAQLEALKKTQPILYRHEHHNENSEYGDYIYNSKNCYYCFDVSHSENCAYMYDSHESKNSFDQVYGHRCELSYENTDSAWCYNSCYIDYCGKCRDCDFCFNCLNCENCFGCVGLMHKQYCFLNRQLTKEEYFKKVAEVKASMV